MPAITVAAQVNRSTNRALSAQRRTSSLLGKPGLRETGNAQSQTIITSTFQDPKKCGLKAQCSPEQREQHPGYHRTIFFPEVGIPPKSICSSRRRRQAHIEVAVLALRQLADVVAVVGNVVGGGGVGTDDAGRRPRISRPSSCRLQALTLVRFDRSRLAFSFQPPTLYTSPKRPAARTRRMALR